MELNSDLISIQSTLCSVVKTTGDLNKIKYKGGLLLLATKRLFDLFNFILFLGNEKLISVVINELEKHFKHEKYILNNEVNVEYEKKVHDILLFLILNCEFKKEFVLEDGAHLIGIVPKLSKCLLAHIIVDLNLGKCCSLVFQSLPFRIQAEILSEILPCLKKSNAEVMLCNTSAFSKRIISQLNITKNASKQVSTNNRTETTFNHC